MFGAWDSRLDLLVTDLLSEGYDAANLEAVIEVAKVYPTANYSLPILLALKRIEDKLNAHQV